MRLLALFFTLIILIAPALAGTGTITISGNSTANATATVTGTNNVVTISAWNTGNGIKTFRVNVTNASDTLTFNLNNFTAGRVNEFKFNSTPQNGYQADSTGLITYTFTQTTGNATYNLQPAVTQGGFNYTWGWFNNPLPNVSIPASALNRSEVRAKMLTFTIDISTTGNQSVTGAGFKPTAYTLICAVAAAGGVPAFIGMSDGGASDGSILNSLEIGAGQWASTNSIGIAETAAGVYNILTHVSFDSDGFTFSKAKTGTPTGTLTCYVKVEK